MASQRERNVSYRNVSTRNVARATPQLSEKQLHQKFKLAAPLSLSNMHAFGADGELMRFSSPHELIELHAPVRLSTYQVRLARVSSTAGWNVNGVRCYCRCAASISWTPIMFASNHYLLRVPSFHYLLPVLASCTAHRQRMQRAPYTAHCTPHTPQPHTPHTTHRTPRAAHCALGPAGTQGPQPRADVAGAAAP